MTVSRAVGTVINVTYTGIGQRLLPSSELAVDIAEPGGVSLLEAAGDNHLLRQSDPNGPT